MSELVVFMSMSLDGFIAAPGDGPGVGLGIGGEPLHSWLTGGTTDPTTHRPEAAVDAAIFDEMLATGAVITGRHTFEWAGDWGGDHHDGVPIFVLTRQERGRPVRGLARYLSDPAEAAARARQAAGHRDVMVHGASSVQALHAADLIDVYVITLVPVVLGSGKRLFAEAPESGRLELVDTARGRGVLHLRYRVVHHGHPAPASS